ncbi:MAG: hypothetical protein ACK559_17350, partial [bacterium]
ALLQAARRVVDVQAVEVEQPAERVDVADLVVAPEAAVAGGDDEAGLVVDAVAELEPHAGEREAVAVIAVEDGLVARLVEGAQVEVVVLVPLGLEAGLDFEVLLLALELGGQVLEVGARGLGEGAAG